MELKRALGTSGLVVHYVTSVMGVGILVLPGIALATAGPASLLAWVALIVFSYPFALIFARMSMRYPNSRGVIDFIEQAFGTRFGSRVAIFLLITLIVGNPLLGIAAGRYLGQSLGIEDNRAVLALGYAIIASSVVVNWFGIRISVRLQGFILAALVAFIVGVCLVALQHADPTALTRPAPHGAGAVGAALVVCFFGFIGWENAAPVAEEVIRPERTFPRAIVIGVLFVGAMYLLMVLTVILVLPPDLGIHEGSTSFSGLLAVSGGTTFSRLGSLVAACLMIMTTNAWTLGTSRYLFGLARSGNLPRKLGSLSGRAAVPRAALLAVGLLYGLTVLGLVMVDGTERTLISLSSSGFLLFFLLGFLSAWRLLKSRVDRVLVVLLCLATTAMLAIHWQGLAFCALGWIAAELLGRMRSRSGEAVRQRG
ncbi:APC family permease [Sorangium cellulosum]|uniref:APC family permease n=1 Tax=Sorangium cellulosum TaxID=56 RepID=UPI003D9A263B